jgi:dipeptidyl aminopeptidase/acylaminoacyl peptidase
MSGDSILTTRLTAEMLVDMPLPGDAQISPDGRNVLFEVSPASKRDKHPNSAIWLASTGGDTPARQITAGTANDTRPRWSPDSSELAFLSDRLDRGTAQIFLMSFAGGEAMPVTDEPGGVTDMCWLPGEVRKIAYLAVDARDNDTQRRRDEDRDDPNVYGEFWPFARVVILDLDSQDTRRIETGQQHVASFSASPDGSRLAITLWKTPDIDHGLNDSQLALIHLASEQIETIGEPGPQPGSITWSLDGKSLYYRSGEGKTPVSSSQIWHRLLDEGTDPVCLTAGLQACITGLARGAGSDTVYTLVASGTESYIGTLNISDGAIQPLHYIYGDAASLSANDDGTILSALVSPAETPPDVYVFKGAEAAVRVTNLHDNIEEVDLGEQEIVTWERAGFGLDGILIWPAGKSREDGPLPAIVSIHGGPYGRWSNSFITRPFGRWLAEHGYLVFLPNPRGGMGHGQAFAEAVLDTVGDDDYLDIMAGVDMLVDQGIADPDRLGCGGWSQGGFMTAWIVGQTDRFKAGVMGAGISDWGMMIATSDIPGYENRMGGGNPYEGIGPHSFDRQSPISYVHKATTPTLIVHGENDARVPVSQAIFFHRGLMKYGVPTELVTYPREPHGIQERNHQLDLLKRVAEWYQRWIPVDSN